MQELWSTVLPLLRQQVGERNFVAWIEPIRCNSDDTGIKLEVPSRFFQDWLTRHFLHTIRDTLTQVAGKPCAVRTVVNGAALPIHRAALCGREGAYMTNAGSGGDVPRSVGSSGSDPSDPSGPRDTKVARTPTIGRLVPHYTFDAFVVGSSNEVAFKAAQAVSAEPGKRFNPIVFHGGVGLGKTHLINGVAHDLLSRYTRLRVACLSAEAFMNNLISSLRQDQMNGFREKFRQVDALILDDIHFLAGKERTQEEFFHTFNALHGGGKQIVLTSDKPPSAITGLEHRLRSRFEGGLLADIQPPTFEMRLKILTAKASRQGIDLPKEAATFLAQATGGSVRELEGALTRVAANAAVRGLPISVKLAEEVLGPLVTSRNISVELIQDTVSRHFGVSVADLKSDRRGRDVTFPRQIAMYLSRKLAAASFPSIAEKFERDHSTVMHAVRVIEARREADATVARLLVDLDSQLRERVPSAIRSGAPKHQ